MVEDVEEGVLRPLADEILDVVDDEDVDLHIVRQEIGELVADVYSVHILGLELVAGDIEDHQLRELLLDRDAYGLGDMGLSAFPFNEVAETIDRVEPGVDPDFLEPGVHEGAGIIGRVVGVDGDGAVHRRETLRGRIPHSLVGLDGMHQIHKARVGPDDPLQGLLYNVKECSFKILAEEVGGHLDGERRLDERHGHDRFEPGRELLGLDHLFYDAEAIVPNVDMSVLNLHRGLVR